MAYRTPEINSSGKLNSTARTEESSALVRLAIENVGRLQQQFDLSNQTNWISLSLYPRNHQVEVLRTTYDVTQDPPLRVEETAKIISPTGFINYQRREATGNNRLALVESSTNTAEAVEKTRLLLTPSETTD